MFYTRKMVSNIFTVQFSFPLLHTELCVPKNHLHHINCISSPSFFFLWYSAGEKRILFFWCAVAFAQMGEKFRRATFPLYFDGSEHGKISCVHRRIMLEYINFCVITYHEISYHGKVDHWCNSRVLFSP